MTRSVQILLLCAYTIPWCAGAAEETMEERKRRIARKYLRERADITYSEEQVPDDASRVGDEELLSAEQFNQIPETIERELPQRQARRPPPMRQRAQPAKNSNWLLAAPEDQANPYAHPFAREDEGEDTEGRTQTAQEDGPALFSGMQSEEESFSRRNDAWSRQPAGSFDGSEQQSIFSPRSRFNENAIPQSQQLPGRYDKQEQEGLYPSAYSQALPYSTRYMGIESEEDPAGGSAYWSSTPNSSASQPYQQSQWGTYTPYQSSYQAEKEQRQQQWGSYTPYQSSYQTQQEQRQQQWGTYTPPEEYKRQDAYQDWKRRNAPQYDPTSEDAYTREMMPKRQR